MHFTKVFALAAIFATGVFATPIAEPDPTKPTKPAKPNKQDKQAKPTMISQNNACGNGVQPFCCNSDGGFGFTSCFAMSGGSQCSTTIVCCNANDSVQVCVGNFN